MNLFKDSLLGKQLDEYWIEAPLGAGGMARVYRALDTKLHRYVALKVVAPELRMNSEHTVRFEREALAIARLEHPNIVHIYRFGEATGLYYIAMQYIQGEDVGKLIGDYRQIDAVMPVDTVVHIIDQICQALDYAHSKGVIHRDVKPNNIIVNEQGQAILTDFGLALLSDTGTQTEIFGSPSYIAPEQAISSANVVPQSDIYALGVTLFEMLTGELPFAGSDPMDIARRHVSEPPPTPSQFNKTIPAGVDLVVLRSLAKEPSERFQTGREFSTALQDEVTLWKQSVVAPEANPSRFPFVAMPENLPEFAVSPLLELPSSSVLADEGASQSAQELTSPRGAAQTIPTTTHPFARPNKLTKLGTVASAISSINWLIPLIIVTILFGVAVIACIIFFFAAHPNNGQSVLAVPSPTSTVISTTPAPTITALPTETNPPLPTPTPVVLGTRSPSSPTLPPPQDRSNPPANSYRLGEFAVESYCNDRGYGVVLINNQSDWACTQPSNNAVVFTLKASDFDNICRARYGRPTAFAIRDLYKDIAAYNWSCYDYLSLPDNNAVAQPNNAVTTPSFKTLVPRYNKDWIALVNVSNMAVSVQGIGFQTQGRTILAENWRQPLLAPGACLRLYRTDTPPSEFPRDCKTVFDYSPGKPEVELWFTQKITIVINPSTSYCYPAEKCISS